jgi:hypothetical protein
MKLFCEMNDIYISWKKISRGVPRGREAANDRAPTKEEIQRLLEYPDRRIKPVVYTMSSSGIRIGAWDSLKWKHVKPFQNENGEIVQTYPMLVSYIVTYVSTYNKYIKRPITFEELVKAACMKNEYIRLYIGDDMKIRNNTKVRSILDLLLNHSCVKRIQLKPTILEWIDRDQREKSEESSIVVNS